MSMLGETKKSNLPWVEKYRPRKIDDVVFQMEVKTVLKKSLTNNNLPNLLLYGPPGTGKTSTILAAASELFGPNTGLGCPYKERILDLNASDERGIAVVRNKIKKFASLSINQTIGGVPNFKLIVLDEADAMTYSAQAALRRIMEMNFKTTKFCIICNYISRIIEPIKSRCAKFRFKPLPKMLMAAKLSDIAENEGIIINDDALDKLVDISSGDLRKAINYLQTGRHFSTILDYNTVLDICSWIPGDVIEGYMRAVLGTSYGDLYSVVSDLIRSGYSASQVLIQVYELLMSEEWEIADKKRAFLLEKLAAVNCALVEGADEHLQLVSFGASSIGTVALV